MNTKLETLIAYWEIYELAYDEYLRPNKPRVTETIAALRQADQQAQPARELLDCSLEEIYKRTHYQNLPTAADIRYARAVIAADRAIRPAAGMVGKSRKEFDAWFDAKSAQILLAPREAIARLIADHLFIEIDRLRAELEAYQKAVLEECGSELAESIELLAAAQEPSNGQG